MMRANIKRGIAVGLMAIMAVINPLQTMQPTGAAATGEPAVAKAAESDKAPYVGEVRLAVDKDAAKAKQILTDAGYEVIDQDLNEKAGSWWNDLKDQAVYMGIKRTDDESKAIRDMKTMNMLGKYSYSDLKKRMEQNKAEARVTYKKFKTAIGEYIKNYNAGDVAAVQSHNMLNVYKEDDSDKLVGDMFLDDPGEEDLLSMFAEGNTYNIVEIMKSLAFGVEEEADDGKTWIDRLSDTPSYSALVKKYAQKKYGQETVVGDQKEEIEKIISADLDETARALLANWQDVRGVFLDIEKAEEAVKNMSESEMTSEDEIIDMFAMYENVANASMVDYAKSVKYGKKTLYHYFIVPAENFEKNIRNLYPLAYALSQGQRALADVMRFTDLFQAAMMRTAVDEEGKKLEDEILEKTDPIVEGAEPVSVYEGVDRAMFADGAAMTSAATSNMTAVDKEKSLTDKVLYGAWIVSGFAALGSLVVAGVLKGLSSWLHDSGMKMVPNYDVSIKSLDDAEKLKAKIGSERMLRSHRVNDTANFWIKCTLVLSAIFAVLSCVEYYMSKSDQYNHKQLPIPDVLVDFDNENDAGRYVTYHVVRWNRDRGDKDRADRADLNGDAAREWLALYTTTDKAMGDPILADGIVANVGDNSVPATAGEGTYAPLTMFGNKSVQNLVDTNYSYYDEVGGIWLWYQKGNTNSETVVDDTEDEDNEVAYAGSDDADKQDAQDETADAAASSGEAELTGSNIGGGSGVFIGIACGVTGLIAGLLIGFFIRRRKQPLS